MVLTRRKSQTRIGPVLGAPPHAETDQIRVLTLEDRQYLDSTLYRLQKGWKLQFRPGPSLSGRSLTVYVNHPAGADDEFSREQYHALEWQGTADDCWAEMGIVRAGSFHYYFVCESSDIPGPHGSGYLTVDPVITLGEGEGESLPLDCVQCQTVISKCLGAFDSWEAKLSVARETGYNVVHFTPVQELGGSNSAYSLRDQLKLNPSFGFAGREANMSDMAELTEKMRTQWKVASVCDIVLNHTANESSWLLEHPEATYNLVTAPHLRPAYLLDATLHRLTVEVSEGLWEHSGIPTVVDCEEHLTSIRSALMGKFLPAANIPELYAADVPALVAQFQSQARSRLPPPVVASGKETQELVLIPDPEYRRLGARVDMELALRLYNVYRGDCFDEDTRLRRCSEQFRQCVELLNAKKQAEVRGHLETAVDNCVAGIRYHRVQPDGPRLKEVSVREPLVPRYFTDHGSPKSITEHKSLLYSADGRFVMAHNGWVMGDDPLSNFAAPESSVYLRRELVAWGDSVKLRYGERPEDCPFLWAHMRRYVEETARAFDGVRLDNCHSTPLPVAEYMLDCARQVRPDLYVIAELFTNSDDKDNIFVNRLGITSLIREALSAWDSHEQGRLVYRYGGAPVGAFTLPLLRPLRPTVAHALFLDLTHDNKSPVETRSVYDLLPSSALVSMACCATGSNRGYDELVPHHIHVVDESRQYGAWGHAVTDTTGITAAKRALNRLHYQLGKDGFDQVFVDQMDANVVAVTRHCPRTHQSVVLVAHTAFKCPDAGFRCSGLKPIRVEGVVEEVVLEAALVHKAFRSGGPRFQPPTGFERDPQLINGLADYELILREHLPVGESHYLRQSPAGDGNMIELQLVDFQPGSVVAVRVSLPPLMGPALATLRSHVLRLTTPDPAPDTALEDVLPDLTLADLNIALYRCSEEERDAPGKCSGVYDVPGMGPLVYCGLQGFMSVLSDIRLNNDLGHPLCGNLRDGNWMIDYVSSRLLSEPGTKTLGQYLESVLAPLKEISRYLVPCYFDVVLSCVHQRLVERAWSLMSPFVSSGSAFVRALAMGSVQCGGVVLSSPLPPLSPSLSPPSPPTRVLEDGTSVQACVTLSAGLPHFATGYMRNWGRDTFISLRGLLLLTGRHLEARHTILGYAACLRHGLIPNLLDGGAKARYNCRDAVWWWLYCVVCYVREVPGGEAILKEPVSRIFPRDDSPAAGPGEADQPLHEVMQEALQKHFQGLCFRERNAGRSIDAHMTDKGFNNQIGVHPETGFVFGGNAWNCGTWMDKMGSSERAGTRGKPATPRDGSAVELVGLSKAVVRWLAEEYEKGRWPYSGVERKKKDGTVVNWSYRDWERRIADNFERHFFVPQHPSSQEARPDLVNRRGIFKDSHGASQAWADYQLRCNFPIAMVVAPEMFEPAHARAALKVAGDALLGPLGMRTLDPSDWAYKGDYDNSLDTEDASTSHGYNYHQGPEWLWPVGFYLRARLLFARDESDRRREAGAVRRLLSRHYSELCSSPWRGLPELTNRDGAFCRDSCRVQAWSMGCLLEVLHDLHCLDASDPARPGPN